MKQLIKSELSKYIHHDIVENIIEEYRSICHDFNIEDDKGILSSSGRFVDMVLAGIYNWYNLTKPNLNKIRFDDLYKEILNFPRINRDSKEELLLQVIPNVSRAIYDVRSKKRGSHRKDFDPIMQDRVFLKESVDWIVSSLLFVFHTKSEKEIKGIIESLVQKDVPIIEEFEDGGIQVLESMSFKLKLLLILYKQNKMISIEELKKLSRPNYPAEFRTNFNNLKKEDPPLIYFNNESVKINQNGIKWIEENIFKEQLN